MILVVRLRIKGSGLGYFLKPCVKHGLRRIFARVKLFGDGNIFVIVASAVGKHIKAAQLKVRFFFFGIKAQKNAQRGILIGGKSFRGLVRIRRFLRLCRLNRNRISLKRIKDRARIHSAANLKILSNF